jgi:predicted RNA polymerase sigma factor
LKNTASGESQDMSNGQFSVHALQFTVTKVDWASLKAFYFALQARSPYIGIEQFTIVADRANPALLNASIKISSVEISHGP